jgi:hypothetical protein
VGSKARGFKGTEVQRTEVPKRGRAAQANSWHRHTRFQVLEPGSKIVSAHAGLSGGASASSTR